VHDAPCRTRTVHAAQGPFGPIGPDGQW
jgi:hypothetical protein